MAQAQNPLPEGRSCWSPWHPWQQTYDTSKKWTLCLTYRTTLLCSSVHRPFGRQDPPWPSQPIILTRKLIPVVLILKLRTSLELFLMIINSNQSSCKFWFFFCSVAAYILPTIHFLCCFLIPWLQKSVHPPRLINTTFLHIFEMVWFRCRSTIKS